VTQILTCEFSKVRVYGVEINYSGNWSRMWYRNPTNRRLSGNNYSESCWPSISL